MKKKNIAKQDLIATYFKSIRVRLKYQANLKRWVKKKNGKKEKLSTETFLGDQIILKIFFHFSVKSGFFFKISDSIFVRLSNFELLN